MQLDLEISSLIPFLTIKAMCDIKALLVTSFLSVRVQIPSREESVLIFIIY